MNTDAATAVLAVLGRIDLATRAVARCCPACGCLLAPAEPCPNVAAHNPRQENQP